jgi:hypothetical protein
MGHVLDRNLGQSEDLLVVGGTHARDIDALCQDVAAAIFPTAIHPPSDAVISAVSVKLAQLVCGIECKLQHRSYEHVLHPETWPLLSQSGFLREADLVDFTLARVAEDRIEARLEVASPSLPAELLDHAEGNVAEAAQILLAADSLHRRSPGSSYLALPAELLHKLCWRIVAALEVSRGERSPDIIAATKDLISNYDEGQTIRAAARKIVHFIVPEQRQMLFTPEHVGLHIFAAAMSAELNLDHDHILRLIEASAATPLAVMLCALGQSKDEAASSLLLLRGQAVSRHEAGLFDKSYQLMDRQAALAEVASWSGSRARYLAFGK